VGPVLWFYIVNLASAVCAVMVYVRGYVRLAWGMAVTSLAVVALGWGLDRTAVPRQLRAFWLLGSGFAAILFVVGLSVLADAWRRERDERSGHIEEDLH
jgi:ABC-type Mn2+/Zn2+ transport system permease subunit